jgi:hypothetical protein
MTDARWKDSLLKSSIPLEHAVAEELARQKWYVWGQYAYARDNESGISVDFSVDLEASTQYSRGSKWHSNLQVLIECKYASPGVKWVFLPYPSTAQLFSGVVQVLDQAANKRVTNRSSFERLEDDLVYCIRGVSLYDSGFDENAIQRGTHQLRYAMPRLAAQTLVSQASDRHDEDITVGFACAILVTTAPLFTLKEGLTLDDVHRAESLNAVVTERESLVLWDSHAPDRLNYTRKLYEEAEPSVFRSRLKSYAEVFVPTKKVKYLPEESNVRRALHNAGDHVLVVSHKHLPSLLQRLGHAASLATKSIQSIATIEFDLSSRTVRVGPVGPTPRPRVAGGA